VSVFEGLKRVHVERHVTVEVHLVERLHRDFLAAAVRLAVLLLLEAEVMLDGPTREAGLLGLAGCILGRDDPERPENREREARGEEDPGLEASAQLPGQPGGHANKQTAKQVVGEGVGAVAVCWKRSIGDGRILQLTIY
jgi:hypothetical protein